MRRQPAFVALLVVLGFMMHSGLILAQMPDRAAMMASAAKAAFKELQTKVDKDQDGKLSKAEFFAVYKDKDKAEKNFRAWDLNEDGFITEEEYVKAVVNISKQRKM